MDYNYNQIREGIAEMVKEACYAPENKFTYTVWEYHVLPVVKHALNLGEMLKGDLEVLELAALLHDYAGILDFRLHNEHHIHGAVLAGETLKDIYPAEKIEHIKECIFCHRGSVPEERKTIEAQIIASADAMSHISELADMFYLTFGIHKHKTEEGCEWLKAKLERSWNKIMPEGRDLIKGEYKNAQKIIDHALRNKK